MSFLLTTYWAKALHSKPEISGLSCPPELEARLEGVGTGEGRRNWEAVEPLPSQDEMAMHDLTLFADSLNEQEKAVLAIELRRC